MKTQDEYAFIPDWQVMNSLVSELENNQETDGIEEEKEHWFYNLAGDEPNKMHETIRRWESNRFMI